jgi:hypothetical protein
MCDPLTLAIGSGVMTAVTQGAGLMGQGAAADAQNRTNRANRTAAVDAAGQEQAQLNRRQIQEEASATEQRISEGSQYRRAAGEAAVIQDARGSSGNSAALVLGDLEATYGRNLGTIDRNLDNTVLQINEQRKGIDAQATARGTSQKVRGPGLLDYGMAALKVGEAGFSAYNRYKPKE